MPIHNAVEWGWLKDLLKNSILQKRLYWAIQELFLSWHKCPEVSPRKFKMDLGLSFGLEWALYTIGWFETLSYFTLTCIFFKIYEYFCLCVPFSRQWTRSNFAESTFLWRDCKETPRHDNRRVKVAMYNLSHLLPCRVRFFRQARGINRIQTKGRLGETVAGHIPTTLRFVN